MRDMVEKLDEALANATTQRQNALEVLRVITEEAALGGYNQWGLKHMQSCLTAASRVVREERLLVVAKAKLMVAMSDVDGALIRWEKREARLSAPRRRRMGDEPIKY